MAVSEDIPPPGTAAHFDWLNRQMKSYWDGDQAFVARSLRSMGVANAASALNRLGKEKRTVPPTFAEITALEATFWDNWAHTGGKRPSERKKIANYNKHRFKLEVEAFDQPEGCAIFGGGNAAVNSIFKGTAITMERSALIKYLGDKREGKGIAKAWKDDEALSAFADDLEALAELNPDALIGPICWTANKKLFVPNMVAMIEGTGKAMVATIIFPDAPCQMKRWTTKRPNNTEIKGKNGEVALQCRATNRADLTAWRNAKIG